MKPYTYKGTDNNLRSCDARDMFDMSKEVQYSSMLRNCDIIVVMNAIYPKLFPHNRHNEGYRLSYHKSMVRKKHCYYLMCKGTAYIFVLEDKKP
jgi:hypothetical protein